MTGSTLGHYRVLEKLAEGGMGVVYRAEDPALKRLVALKVLPSELASDEHRRERFQREAESLAALNHPNIVHVYSVEEDQDVHFLTMELVEGESLDRLVSPPGLPVEQLLELAPAIADALAEAHSQGIVHRDLKPANIMVDGKGRPKVLDFGLAMLRQTEASNDLSQGPTELLTQRGAVFGTFPYMSPEQVEGKVVDHRSDIFSFGTVLYEMATGKRPFQGDSPVSLGSSILRDSPTEVSRVRQHLPSRLDRIVGRCLEKDPNDRYQRAEDLRNDLEDLRLGRQRAQALPGTSEGLSKGRREQTGFRVAALSLVVVAIALFLSWPMLTRGTRINSIAVLPLENLSDDPEQEYFADGITAELIADLGRISALRVISRRSVMRFKRSDQPLPEIARELGVDALIEGSVFAADDQIRVTTQLVRAEPEELLWTNTYNRDARQVFRLLSDISRAVADEVLLALSPQEEERLARAEEVEPEAHRAFLRALDLTSIGTPDAWIKAGEPLRQAVAIDPAFARAWVALAEHYAVLAVWFLPSGDEAGRIDAIEQMNVALDRALETDDSLGRAHATKGLVHAFIDWDWPLAEQEFKRAIELSPNDSYSRVTYAEFLAAMGRSDEALYQATVAVSLDPLSAPLHGVVGRVYYWGRDFATALTHLDRSVELAPQYFEASSFRGWVLAALEREQEAVRAWQQMQSQYGNYLLAGAFEGRSLDEVNRLWLDFFTSLGRAFVTPDLIATVHAMVGQNDKALEWLERAYATRDDPGKSAGPRFIFLGVDPAFDALHSDPRFQDLLQRMNLSDPLAN